MRALDTEVVDAIWAAIEPIVPIPADDHPLGCHNPRIDDRVCFEAILNRLVLGCSWETVEHVMGYVVSDTTVRSRRNEWIAAGVFDRLADEALAAYDRIIGLTSASARSTALNTKHPAEAQVPGRTRPTAVDPAGSGHCSRTATASPSGGPPTAPTATT